MTKIVGICLKNNGKIYFFNTNGFNVKIGDVVIVETKMGEEFATVKTEVREIDDEKIKDTMKRIIKIADKKDLEIQKINEADEKKAYEICKKKIAEHKLAMNLIEAKFLYDRSKLIFYFTADTRIDFRELVKDLASIFKTRIELRQISIRDQAKRLCGNGVCGRELCCASFLKNYDGVTIKMAKEQNLSLNSSKITGRCGRLMCCLKYEQNVYEEKLKRLPHVGATVKCEDGEGVVDSVETLKENVEIKLKDENGEFFYRKYPASKIKIIKDTNNNNFYKNNNISNDEEDIDELKKIEQMDKFDKKNVSSDDE